MRENPSIVGMCRPLLALLACFSSTAMAGEQGFVELFDGGERWTGMNYEERGRTFLAYRG